VAEDQKRGEDSTALAKQGGLLGALNQPVEGKISRGALWGCGILLGISLLNDLGIKFSSETTGWLVLFSQTLAGYLHQEEKK
jgi:hypothetical protein